MQIGTFRRNVVKTLPVKATKTALRLVSKNTARTQIARAAVAFKGHTGQLLQVLGRYLLGLPQSQEMKDQATETLGDIGYDLTALARALKAKLPSITKKSKLVGTRGAAILQLDSLATDILRQVEQSLFAAPEMTTVKKMVPMPQKGGVKEERDVDIVDLAAAHAADLQRQEAMTSFLTGAIDVYWRLCFDLTGEPPAKVLAAKFARMKKEFPAITFDAGEKKLKSLPPPPPAPVKGKKGKKAQPEAVTV